MDEIWVSLWARRLDVSDCPCYHKTPLKEPDSKVHGANMGPTWDLSAPDGPHVGPMNLAIRGQLQVHESVLSVGIALIVGNFAAARCLEDFWESGLISKEFVKPMLKRLCGCFFFVFFLGGGLLIKASPTLARPYSTDVVICAKFCPFYNSMITIMIA